MKELTLFDQHSHLLTAIHHDGDMVSLTDLWKASGSPVGKRTQDWLRNADTQEFIDFQIIVLKGEKSHLLKVKRGVGGGTWAHKHIALRYAQYLSPSLATLVNEVFFQRVKEEKNPDLIAERYRRTYRKLGKSDEWIAARFNGINARLGFTACLKEHDVDGKGYGDCTNAIYTPLFGGGSEKVRAKYEIEPNANVRDHLPELSLIAIEFAEALAKEHITKNDVRGNRRCKATCLTASQSIAESIVQFNHKTA